VLVVVEGAVGVFGDGMVGVVRFAPLAPLIPSFSPCLVCAVPPRGFVEFSGVAVVPFDAIGVPA
jgi:hypothetical protein